VLSSPTFRAVIGEQLVVVADAHFGAAPRADEEAFLAFLDGIAGLGDSLLIAGDLYDFWFTYHRVIPRHCIRVTAAVVALARRMPVLMIGGNHDRWGGSFWSEEAGIRFDPRELRFTIGQRAVRAVHGDGIHQERRAAAVLNYLIATRPVIAAFRRLPAALGFRVADALGHDPAWSRAHPEVLDQSAVRQAAWARQALLAEPALGALVMGHTHRPALDLVGPDRFYLNPGPWIDEHEYAIIDHAGARLARFS
jgi:UDP-2,3-diacylglucosamine hydrolase